MRVFVATCIIIALWCYGGYLFITDGGTASPGLDAIQERLRKGASMTKLSTFFDAIYRYVVGIFRTSKEELVDPRSDGNSTDPAPPPAADTANPPPAANPPAANPDPPADADPNPAAKPDPPAAPAEPAANDPPADAPPAADPAADDPAADAANPDPAAEPAAPPDPANAAGGKPVEVEI